MFRLKYLAIWVIAALGLVACDSDLVEETAVVADVAMAKPGPPFSINYKIIGTPIIGSPVTIELRIVSALGPRPVSLTYRINDASAMMFGESQLQSVNLEPAANETSITQQVIVIPLREGRLYLNVNASIATQEGTVSTAMAIPVQVGTGTRELLKHGELEIDENGEAVRVLSGD